MFRRIEMWYRGMVTFVLGTICVIIGICLTAIQDHRRDSAFQHVQTGEFELIVFFEDEPAVEKKIVAAHRAALQQQPVLVINENDNRQYFATQDDSARFIQERGSSQSVVRALFKEPNALNKAKQWLKNHNYSPSDFSIEPENTKRSDTVSVYPRKGESGISICGYFSARGREYMWTGNRIMDLSDGFTSDAKKNNQQVTAERHEYINALKNIAE